MADHKEVFKTPLPDITITQNAYTQLSQAIRQSDQAEQNQAAAQSSHQAAMDAAKSTYDAAMAEAQSAYEAAKAAADSELQQAEAAVKSTGDQRQAVYPR